MKILILADKDGMRFEENSEKVDLVISCGDLIDQTILKAAKAHQ